MARTGVDGGRNVQTRASSKRVSLTDSICEAIRDRIVFSEVLPGDILGEARLAEEYGVSKTPVREALGLLSQENLVEVLPRVGYRVTGIGLHEVHEVYHLRILLEAEAAALAARRAERDDVLELRRRNGDSLERLVAEGAPSSKSYTRYHDAFHLGIAVLSGSERLTRFIRSLLQDSTRIRVRDPLMSVEGFDEDRELAERMTAALVDRDEARSRDLMREHLVQSKARILDRLTDPDSMGPRAASRGGVVID